MSERYVVSRIVAAPPTAVFALLTDIDRHQETEPSDWVRGAVEAGRITEVGQVFAVHMYLDAVGGAYVMHNLVTDLVPERTVAWLPGQLDDAGAHDAPGWTWRYDLAPAGESATTVTLTYDWSATPEQVRAEMGGLPPFGPDYLEASLAALAEAVEGRP